MHFCRWKKLTFVFWHWITLVHHKNDVNTENCFQNGVRRRIWPLIITSHQFISGNLAHINRQRERDKVHKIHKNRDTQNTHIKQTEGHAEANTDKNRIKWRVLKLQRSHAAHTQFKFKSQKWATTRLLHAVHSIKPQVNNSQGRAEWRFAVFTHAWWLGKNKVVNWKLSLFYTCKKIAIYSWVISMYAYKWDFLWILAISVAHPSCWQRLLQTKIQIHWSNLTQRNSIWVSCKC